MATLAWEAVSTTGCPGHSQIQPSVLSGQPSHPDMVAIAKAKLETSKLEVEPLDEVTAWSTSYIQSMDKMQWWCSDPKIRDAKNKTFPPQTVTSCEGTSAGSEAEPVRFGPTQETVHLDRCSARRRALTGNGNTNRRSLKPSYVLGERRTFILVCVHILGQYSWFFLVCVIHLFILQLLYSFPLSLGFI